MKKALDLLKKRSADGVVRSLVIEPRCVRCSRTTARIEITPPNEWPEGSDAWQSERRDRYAQRRNFTRFYLMYHGLGGNNGDVGDGMDESEAVRILEAFSNPPVPNKVQEEFHDGAGLCLPCEEFYCATHWGVDDGFGRCPRGHGKSLDPHWSPDW